MKHYRVLLTLLLLAFSLLSHADGKRVALIIANSQYQNIKALKNPKNDAEAVAERLKKAGFTLIHPIQNSDVQYDLSLKQLFKANSALKQEAKGAEMVLLYYAGHGLQIDSVPYLVPVDLSTINAESLKDDGGRELFKRELLELDKLVAGLDDHAQVAIAMFDACREIPELETASRAVFGVDASFRGLARPQSQGRHRLLAYSALSGQLANDGNAEHSPYTQAWLTEFDKNTGMDILAFYNQVASQLKGQIAEVVTQGITPNTYYFQGVVQTSNNNEQQNVEINFWNSIKNSQNPADFQAYLKKYPNGDFVELAKNRLQTEAKPTPSVKPEATATRSAFEPEMVAIKGGCFMMGSPESNPDHQDNERQHEVCVKDFEIGKYEVTQAQWQTIMGSNPSQFKGDNLPVGNVSYNDTQKFIKKLNNKTGKNYRLPTEAEWEYACRSMGQEQTYCGDGNLADLAWYYGTSDYDYTYDRKTYKVGTKKANALGLFDMSGNVWEWTCSAYVKDYDGSETRCSTNSSSTRVLRGSSSAESDWSVRSTIRYSNSPDERSSHFGFRFALGQPDS